MSSRRKISGNISCYAPDLLKLISGSMEEFGFPPIRADKRWIHDIQLITDDDIYKYSGQKYEAIIIKYL